MKTPPKGLVFNIQKFSLHDGPGIRTIVFLKGCPLACVWCSNPEGRSHEVELVESFDRCIGSHECDRCVGTCSTRAIAQGAEGRVTVDRSRCDSCGDCADACPSDALQISGDWLGVDDVLRVVEEDDAFYARSGGGLTLSGGEPLAQGAFVLALLREARGRGIDTAIETSGLCKWATLEQAAMLADRIFFDIKCLDGNKHERVTGVPNDKILDNFRRLRAVCPDTPVFVRTPVIPGVNDSEDDIASIARFIRDAGRAAGYDLLPYHGFGAPKYSKLGEPYRMSHLEPPAPERMASLERLATV